MSSHNREIHRSKTSSSAFLLSRSEPCGPMPEYGPGTDESASWMTETLTGSFPDVIPPGKFVEKALSVTGSTEKFAAMILRFDELDLSAEPESAVLEAAGSLDAACREHGGLWGIFDRDMLACVLPGAEGSKCTETAAAVSEKLSEQTNDTVSAGIANYPELEFSRREVIENAQKALEHAEFFGPDSRIIFDSVSLNISGDKYYQAGHIEAAVNQFKKALALDPENVNVLNSLGVCRGVQEDYDSALECFEKAARIDPGEAMAVYNAGYVHLCMKNYDKALDLFLEAAGIDKGLFEAVFQAGRVYMDTNRPEQAKKHLEKAVELNSNSGAAHRFLGDCYALLDRDTDAAAAYKNALKLRPDDAEALSALGFLYEIQERNPDIALMFCSRAAEMNPENGIFRHRLGRIYYNRGMYEQALAEFEAAIAGGHQGSGEYAELIRPLTEKKENVK
ncbi:MAG: tetratricopeptide repeat protein [Desulfosalsimonas sp.]